MDEYKVFTFDSKRFPDPKGTNDYLHERGFRSVWILDPAVKVEEGYAVYEQGVAGDHFLKDSDGREYHAWTWPGDAAFPDYTRPETRAWWKELTTEFLKHGMDGVWVDLNEPSPILPPGSELPDDLEHRGGGDIAPGTHAQYHNVYGLLMAKATYEAIQAARPERRPFVLTRSSYLGGQRFAATWTGDNVASWDHLYWSVPMILNLGLSGQPNSGPDIGGFAGTPTPELFERWMGVGAFLPFCRAHYALRGDHEPWSFGPAVEESAPGPPSPVAIVCCPTSTPRSTKPPPPAFPSRVRSSSPTRPTFRFAAKTTRSCSEATYWCSLSSRRNPVTTSRCPRANGVRSRSQGKIRTPIPHNRLCGFETVPFCRSAGAVKPPRKPSKVR
jgi:hypothetical protein